MDLDLVDHLRCPRPHPGVPGGVALVCVPTRLDGRTVIEAMLGCPTCHARFAVAAGAGWFGDGEAPPAGPLRQAHDGTDEAMRLAALLNLDSPGGRVLLHGDWGAHAVTLAGAAECHAVVLAEHPDPAAGRDLSILCGVHAALPLAPGSLRGVAFGLGTGALPSEALVVSAGVALTGNGRLVAPVGCTQPPGFVELARDSRYWVAERQAEPVAIRRAPPRPPPHTPGR
ncbi:MAG: hypothetical protein HY275_08810 [Gemmatimonadetes bacterium]|nr:hypothetical protein [Gemmatimonadota bacterium]